MNVSIHVCFDLAFSVSLDKYPRSETPGSYGNFIFSFLGKLYNGFHSDCTNFNPTNSEQGFSEKQKHCMI